MTEQTMPPANWYADPAGSGRWRYWDGSAWTGVYLNQPEPGPSVWAQYWELARWYVFGAALLAIPFAAALGPGLVAPAIVLANITMQRREQDPPFAAVAALVASATVGAAIWGGWPVGLGAVACGVALVLLARYRNRLPEQVLWFAVAFIAFGIVAIIATAADLWRG